MSVKFDVFYGGHVAMDDIGYAGTPVDDRILSDTQLASAYGEARAMAELMDGLGYDTMWLAEHHFQHEGHAAPAGEGIRDREVASRTGRRCRR